MHSKQEEIVNGAYIKHSVIISYTVTGIILRMGSLLFFSNLSKQPYYVAVLNTITPSAMFS